MSLVCHNWSNELSSPSLWRRVTFRYRPSQSNAELCSEVVFAGKYGAMFHHVEILFHLHHFHTLDVNAKRQLKFFLQALTRHSRLLSISYTLMRDYHEDLDDRDYSEFSETTLSFFQSQDRLQHVELNECLFKPVEAARILEVLFRNNAETLRDLHLKEFVVEQPREEFTGIAADDDLNFRVFMNLEVLSINYALMLENMMLSFYEYSNAVDMKGRTGRLREVKLIHEAFNTDDYLRIDPDVWQYFRDIFPDLGVDLKWACLSCDPTSLSAFLVHRMPLRSLDFYFLGNTNSETEVGILLRHITSRDMNKSLEVLVIVWHAVSPNLAPDLMSFTNVCTELTTSEVEIEHPVEGLEAVFKSWLENRPASLRDVKFFIRFIDTEEEKNVYINLIGFYKPLLQTLGINLSLLI